MAQRIMNIEERVDTIEKKIETESTMKRTELKQHDSELERINKQIEKINQEMKKLRTQLKTSTTMLENNNLVIVGIKEEEDENTHAKFEELARTLQCELTYFQASRLGSTTKNRAGTSGNKSWSRPILVWFVTTWERRKLYACREKIQSSQDTNLQKIFANEDLSKELSAMFYLAQKTKKSKLIHNAWMYQGTVHISKESKGTPTPNSNEVRFTWTSPGTEDRRPTHKLTDFWTNARKIVRGRRGHGDDQLRTMWQAHDQGHDPANPEVNKASPGTKWMCEWSLDQRNKSLER